MLGRLNHVAIAVPDLAEACALWRDLFDVKVGETESFPELEARVAILDTGECKTELVEPLGESSSIARFLDSGRKGIHHVAYRVDDIDDMLRRLRESGVPLVHEKAVAGSRGTRIAFVHPRGTGGVLLELVEVPR